MPLTGRLSNLNPSNISPEMKSMLQAKLQNLPDSQRQYLQQKFGGSRGKGGGTETYPNAPNTRTLQPTLPGFNDMVASQLQAGFGSGLDAAGLDALMSDLYQPMTIHQFQEPITITGRRMDAGRYAPISTGDTTLDKLLSRRPPKLPDADDKKKDK